MQCAKIYQFPALAPSDFVLFRTALTSFRILLLGSFGLALIPSIFIFSLFETIESVGQCVKE
jgi:hypothetical protein